MALTSRRLYVVHRVADQAHHLARVSLLLLVAADGERVLGYLRFNVCFLKSKLSGK